jgi:excisionase family DNA binding protein
MKTRRPYIKSGPSAATLIIDPDPIAKAIVPYLAAFLDERVPAAEPAPNPLLLTIPMLVERTGLSLSYIKRLLQERKIKALRIGDRRVITFEEFQRWVATLPVATTVSLPLPTPSKRGKRARPASSPTSATPEPPQPAELAPPTPPRPPRRAEAAS